MSMKRNILAILAMCIVTILITIPVSAQNSEPHAQGPSDLRGSLSGKWKLYDSKATKEMGTWEFQSDGKFLSTGDYWGNKSGLYRTDETRSVLILEIDEKITEWSASVKENMLALKEVTNGSKKPAVVLSLQKIDIDHK